MFIASFAEWQEKYPLSASIAADGGYASAATLRCSPDGRVIGVVSFYFTAPVNLDDEYRALYLGRATAPRRSNARISTKPPNARGRTPKPPTARRRRLPVDNFARAAHAVERHPRVGGDAAERIDRCHQNAARSRSSTTRPGRPPHRRAARRVANRGRPGGARPPGSGSRREHPRRGRRR